MFEELKSTLALEAEVLAFWKDQDIFAEGLRLSAGRPSFVFYEGPPTANGTPHNGHVLTRAIKDLFPRYKTMRGYDVRRKAGWDTHGLPVEVEVEKTLGMHGKAAIEAYGLEPFARRCIESVFTYTSEWEQLTDQVGFWVDMDDAYVTYHRSYVESVWWALSELYDKGLLYRGHKVIWWWPQGGTALSSGEVGQGYKQVDDPSVTVRFRLEGEPATSLLAWTTTPWTLPSNTAIAVNPKLDYAWVAIPGGSQVKGLGLVETDEVVVLADGLRDKHGLLDFEVVKTEKGTALLDRRYAPVFDFATPEGDKHWVVIPGEHVTLEAGTGLVHTAPAFGEDDYKAAHTHGVGMLQLVAPDGTFVAGTGFLEGQFCKDADSDIIRDLKTRGLLFKRETYRHDYPFCWRKDSDPLIQYARPAWFIRTTTAVQTALDNNDSVQWLPDHIRTGRFGDFLRNNVDWALSRERFWGTPLNIWQCEHEACGHEEAPSSTAELKARNPAAFAAMADVDEHLQVHKPWIDRVTLPCPKCGGTMHRVPEVIDCWFDSGSMPFAQWGFPHAPGSVEKLKSQFPADFISEAVDQTRGWFYSLLMISTLLFDDATCDRYGLDAVGLPRPYKTCIVLGHVGDMEGRKESKSKGNYTPPDLVFRGQMKANVVADDGLEPGQVGFKQALVRSLDLSPKERFRVVGPGGERHCKVVRADVTAKDAVHLHPSDIATLGLDGQVVLKAPFAPPGADAFRWLFYAANQPWTSTRLSLKALREVQREFLLRLRNVHAFFTIYANIEGFTPGASGAAPVAERGALDRWILSELALLVAEVTERMDAYRLYEAARAVQGFVEQLSNWYVRRSRKRFWGQGDDTANALATLYDVLVTLSRVLAPYVPFTAEALHQSLVAGQVDGAGRSVHHEAWPEVREDRIDRDLAERMAVVRELASLGLAARSQVGVRVRQPLAAAEVVLADGGAADGLSALLPLLTEELNVREVRFSEDAGRFVNFQVRPNYKALGRRLGKDMKACAAQLNQRPAAEVRAAVLAGGLVLDLPSGPVTLNGDDVEVRVSPKGTFQAAGSATAVVALDSELNDDLREEGLARELINRIQGVRKDLSLGYTDRIQVRLGGDAALVAAAERFGEHIAGETLASSWQVGGDAPAGARTLDVDGRTLVLQVERA